MDLRQIEKRIEEYLCRLSDDKFNDSSLIANILEEIDDLWETENDGFSEVASRRRKIDVISHAIVSVLFVQWKNADYSAYDAVCKAVEMELYESISKRYNAIKSKWAKNEAEIAREVQTKLLEELPAVTQSGIPVVSDILDSPRDGQTRLSVLRDNAGRSSAGPGMPSLVVEPPCPMSNASLLDQVPQPDIIDPVATSVHLPSVNITGLELLRIQEPSHSLLDNHIMMPVIQPPAETEDTSFVREDPPAVALEIPLNDFSVLPSASHISAAPEIVDPPPLPDLNTIPEDLENRTVPVIAEKPMAVLVPDETETVRVHKSSCASTAALAQTIATVEIPHASCPTPESAQPAPAVTAVENEATAAGVTLTPVASLPESDNTVVNVLAPPQSPATSPRRKRRRFTVIDKVTQIKNYATKALERNKNIVWNPNQSLAAKTSCNSTLPSLFSSSAYAINVKSTRAEQLKLLYNRHLLVSTVQKSEKIFQRTVRDTQALLDTVNVPTEQPQAPLIVDMSLREPPQLPHEPQLDAVQLPDISDVPNAASLVLPNAEIPQHHELNVAVPLPVEPVVEPTFAATLIPAVSAVPEIHAITSQQTVVPYEAPPEIHPYNLNLSEKAAATEAQVTLVEEAGTEVAVTRLPDNPPTEQPSDNQSTRPKKISDPKDTTPVADVTRVGPSVAPLPPPTASILPEIDETILPFGMANFSEARPQMVSISDMQHLARGNFKTVEEALRGLLRDENPVPLEYLLGGSQTNREKIGLVRKLLVLNGKWQVRIVKINGHICVAKFSDQERAFGANKF